MNPLSIGSATAVYADAGRCEIIRHWVDHPALAQFSHSLRRLVQSLGDEAADEYWRNTLGPIRRLAFVFCSTPLPFARAAVVTGTDWDRVNRHVRLCQQLFPDSHESLVSLAQKLQQLSAEASSPFIGPLEELARQGCGLSIVIRNPRMNQAVAAYVAGSVNLRDAQVISAMQLRGAHVSNALAVIGPCGWHPEYIFSAPRAPIIHVISFRWIRDTWTPGPIFLKNSNGSDGKSRGHRIGALPSVGGEFTRNHDSLSEILPLDLLPPLPAFASSGLSSASSHPDSSAETVLARLCHLSGNRAVFVAADESASSLVIDMSEMGHAAVGRVHVDELEPGQYLLLRTSGGGDFIAPLADRVLGESAAQRRSQQAEWKERLIARATERFGSNGRRELSAQVSLDLRSRGLSQSRPANVHYWMSSKCIRPRKEEDFVAILTFAGLETRAQELWSAMEDIDRAHRRAGHLIRRMLLQKIADTSLEPLERDGEMVFDLGDDDGGTLSAFQITVIVPEEIEVPGDRIGVLLETEE